MMFPDNTYTDLNPRQEFELMALSESKFVSIKDVNNNTYAKTSYKVKQLQRKIGSAI